MDKLQLLNTLSSKAKEEISHLDGFRGSIKDMPETSPIGAVCVSWRIDNTGEPKLYYWSSPRFCPYEVMEAYHKSALADRKYETAQEAANAVIAWVDEYLKSK